MSVRGFSKVLIANRGEIACRVIRTLRRLGVRSVAVYSDADRESLHVRSADEAVHLGGSAARESYLAIEKILAAAKRTGAEAIHPGYGLLSENASFAEACADAGVVFIGPPASAIRAMGSKSAAKALMQAAGVPLTPGYHGENQDAEFLREQARAIGYPVMIKASAGGGGKGMRRVEEPGEFAAALGSCKREASASFGDDRVLIERYIVRPRHIEIQVFADGMGNVVSLFERDCSVQRRNQKVIEEAPAAHMQEDRRAAMSRAACDAARAVGYVGAGTVEFIVGPQGDFHFMEMNTRLQVEHPVTEMITGLDLVEWQLRVAAGERLPLLQEQIGMRGHAIEARIYAEDPEHGFMPSTGRITHFRMPVGTEFVRVDAGVEEGDAVSSFYDPMIGKLIVWDESRPAAVRRMMRALSEVEIAGVLTNVSFVKGLVGTEAFAAAEIDTGFIEREGDRALRAARAVPAEAVLIAALGVVLNGGSGLGAEEEYSPWAVRDGWRVNGALRRRLVLTEREQRFEVWVEYGRDAYRMQMGAALSEVAGCVDERGAIEATMDQRRMRGTIVRSGGGLQVFLQGNSFAFTVEDPLARAGELEAAEGDLLAPLPGRVTALLVEPKVHVEKGAALLVLEAMKMEYTIAAPSAGRVQAFFFGVGEQVTEGAQLLQFERGAEGGSERA